GPESCAGTRESAGEALTGESTGGVLSREIRCNQGADAVELCGRQNTDARNGEGISDPARSKTSSTCGNSMRENREIPCLPPGDGLGGRAGKVDDRNPATYRHGKSDSPEAIEQSEYPRSGGGGGKGADQGERASAKHAPDTEPGSMRAQCAGARATSSDQEQGRAIQRAPPPRDGRASEGRVSQHQEERDARSRRCHMGALPSGP